MDDRPGLNPVRMARLMRRAVATCELDLRDTVVLTEAASGAYVVTPVIAAMAGASRVFAVARTTRYGSAEAVVSLTRALADAAGVPACIEFIAEKTADVVSQADIVTNSGHVRPVDAATVAAMKDTAVISLMYEAWEFRSRDVDLAACHRKGIAVAGTNEHHPEIGIFPFMGAMAVKALMDAGVALRGSRVLVLCDNSFRPFIAHDLQAAGASADALDALPDASHRPDYDAVLVALTPRTVPVLDDAAGAAIAERWPGAVIVQFWGDLDRASLSARGIRIWPEQAPATGHMGILPSAIGPEPIVLLQAGGLKTGEVLARARRGGQSVADAIRALMRSNYGTALEEHTTR